MKKKSICLIVIALCILFFYHYKTVDRLKKDFGTTLWLLQMDQGDNLSYVESIIKSREISDEEFRTIHRLVKFDSRVSYLSGNFYLENYYKKIDSLLERYFKHSITKTDMVKQLKELLKSWEGKIDYKGNALELYNRTYKKFRKEVWRR